eukprot:767923-Hanusia_phi.AAC.2
MARLGDHDKARQCFGADHANSRPYNVVEGRVKHTPTQLNRTMELCWGWTSDNGETPVMHAGIIPGGHCSTILAHLVGILQILKTAPGLTEPELLIYHKSTRLQRFFMRLLPWRQQQREQELNNNVIMEIEQLLQQEGQTISLRRMQPLHFSTMGALMDETLDHRGRKQDMSDSVIPWTQEGP